MARILADPGTPARLALPPTLRVLGVVFLILMTLGHLPAVFAIGIADLVVAAGVAALVTAGLLDATPSTGSLRLLPLALVPTAAVPLAVALHIISLRRLHATAVIDDRAGRRVFVHGRPPVRAPWRAMPWVTRHRR